VQNSGERRTGPATVGAGEHGSTRAVTIVTANDSLVIPRGEIQSLTQGEISMMPEGLLQALTEAEVRDLIAYLKSPAQAPPPKEEEK
jgi:hypothetical protein